MCKHSSREQSSASLRVWDRGGEKQRQPAEKRWRRASNNAHQRGTLSEGGRGVRELYHWDIPFKTQFIIKTPTYDRIHQRIARCHLRNV